MSNPQPVAGGDAERPHAAASIFDLLQECDEQAASVPEATAIELVNKTKRELRKDLDDISGALDWSEPSIAFYGETNAGKSTLIEALRILFNSAGKHLGDAIGDGSPDYTRVATSYACYHDGAQFNLVDVPGIEGDEAKVADAIQEAVHRAHAVFYVTADARPPQGGDGGRMGTLEKIKRQLKPQAKVWAVYNKKLNNPRQVAPTLMNEDESRSLADGSNSLDGKMREVLGDHYQGHIVASALPAFLALAEDLPEDSRFLVARAKFLDKVSAENLLTFSNLENFGKLIRHNVPTLDEIADANIGKLVPPIEAAAGELASAASKQFGIPAEELREKLAKLAPELELISEDASKGLLRLTDELINGGINRVREKMLAAIDEGVSGDAALIAKFEEIVAEERSELSEIVDRKVRSTVERTMQSCREAIAVLDHNLKLTEVFKSSAFTASFSHALEANGGWGVDWSGLAGAGVALAFGFGTGGWGFFLTGSSATIGAIRSVWNVFDRRYLKSEQKRSLNNGLDKIKPKMRADICKELYQVECDLKAHALNTIKPFLSIERQMHEANDRLCRFQGGLSQAAKSKTVVRAYAVGANHNDVMKNRSRLLDIQNILLAVQTLSKPGTNA